MSFNGKLAIVTGGVNGIGKQIALSFLQEGASVAVLDIDEAGGKAFAKNHKNLRFYLGDVASPKTLEAFAADIAVHYEKVDYLINNACVSRKGLLSGCSWQDFEYVQRIGVTAPYYLTSLLREYFAKDASIINISSTRYLQSQSNTESYSAAKGGITALTHALAASLAGVVRVNAVSPGWIETASEVEHSSADRAQHLAGRVGKPEDIAEMVLFLCSEKAGFITGQNFVVDGGMTKLMVYNDDRGWKYEEENRQ